MGGDRDHLRQFPSSVDELHQLFIQGRHPDPPLDGYYEGLFLRLSVNSRLDALVRRGTNLWMPWRGKRFVPARNWGDNRFDNSVLGIFSKLWPSYQGMTPRGDGTFEGLAFRTWSAPGILDPEVNVFKIDYRIPATPQTMHRILDELVELPDGRLLGKAHFLTLRNNRSTIVYFALVPPTPAEV